MGYTDKFYNKNCVSRPHIVHISGENGYILQKTARHLDTDEQGYLECHLPFA